MADVAPYSRYAAVYSATGQAAFGLRAWSHVRRRLRSLGWQGRVILDVAGGTGAVAARMTGEGYQAVCCDLSREMLLVGRWELDPPTLRAQGDARRLPFADAAFDLVTCFYDSLNYLLREEDLQAACAEAGRVLKPGGWFVFDLNSEEHLKSLWTGVCHAAADDALATIWVGRWLPERRVSSLRATFFTRGEDGRWDRFDEVHDERGFTTAELEAALAGGGLRLHRTEDARDGGKPTASSRRLLYFARRDRSAG